MVSLEPWRFEGTDAIAGSGWKMSTHSIRLFGAAANRPVVANGVIVHLSTRSEDAAIRVSTSQGNFAVRLNEIPYGTGVTRMDGRVFVDRVPPPVRITETPDEEDFPSAAVDKNGAVWLAYSVFRHHPDHDRSARAAAGSVDGFRAIEGSAGRRPDLCAALPARRVGTGDRGDAGRRRFVPHGDRHRWRRHAVGVLVAERGGQLRNLRQRDSKEARRGGRCASRTRRDRTWVRWRRRIPRGRCGWRGRDGATGARRFSRRPSGVRDLRRRSRFRDRRRTSGTRRSRRTLGRSGRVTVAWDSYRNGNYDVYLRTAAAGTWGSEVAVAASARYEAYPSIAYDGSGRLWVAYEEGGSGWGKDFGAYRTDGVALYQGRAIRIRGFEADGRAIEPASDVGAVLPGIPRRQGGGHGAAEPRRGARPANRTTRRTGARTRRRRICRIRRNTSPRLLVDASGRMWLAFRSPHPIWWNPIGTVWTEYVVSLAGAQWTRPIFLTHTDNLLDNRPALVSTGPGQLLAIGSADNRRQFHLSERGGATTNNEPAPPVDPFNNDLYANEIRLGAATQAVAARPSTASGGPAAAPVEAQAIQMLRAYRTRGRGAVPDRARRVSPAQRDLDGWRPGRVDLRPVALHHRRGRRWTGWAAAITTTAAGASTPGG